MPFHILTGSSHIRTEQRARKLTKEYEDILRGYDVRFHAAQPLAPRLGGQPKPPAPPPGPLLSRFRGYGALSQGELVAGPWGDLYPHFHSLLKLYEGCCTRQGNRGSSGTWTARKVSWGNQGIGVSVYGPGSNSMSTGEASLPWARSEGSSGTAAVQPLPGGEKEERGSAISASLPGYRASQRRERFCDLTS